MGLAPPASLLPRSLDSPEVEVLLLRSSPAAFVHTGAGHRAVVDVALDVRRCGISSALARESER